MKHVQTITRMFFRGFVVSMVIINYNHEAMWAIPFGLLVALCSEAEYMSGK